MRERAIPEHPDVARERRRERWAVVFGLGGIAGFFGLVWWTFAAYAQYVYWKGREIPPDVQASINQEFTLGYWFIGIGIAVMIGSYLVWWRLRRQARRAIAM